MSKTTSKKFTVFITTFTEGGAENLFELMKKRGYVISALGETGKLSVSKSFSTLISINATRLVFDEDARAYTQSIYNELHKMMVENAIAFMNIIVMSNNKELQRAICWSVGPEYMVAGHIPGVAVHKIVLDDGDCSDE